MGMAASQARFLQLTARRTNIEFMGQQINQQRVALANQSAGLFEKMLTLEPPTPPSSLDDQYYTQGYTFKDGVDDNGTATFRGDDVNKKVSWSQLSGEAGSPAATATAFTITSSNDASQFDVTYAMLDDLVNSEATQSTGAVGGASFNGVEIDADLEQLMTDLSLTANDDADRIVMRYVSIEHNIYDPDGNYQTVQEQMPAILEFDNLNRLVNMTLVGDMTTTDADIATGGANEPSDWTDVTNLGGAAYSTEAIVGQGEELTYSGVFDETAYNDDMNKYEFEKSAYDYQIERINLETAKIQKQDKSLELKMKQLDTEHKAIQTEMDAVSKVIQKNIESSFKTFG